MQKGLSIYAHLPSMSCVVKFSFVVSEDFQLPKKKKKIEKIRLTDGLTDRRKLKDVRAEQVFK